MCINSALLAIGTVSLKRLKFLDPLQRTLLVKAQRRD